MTDIDNGTEPQIDRTRFQLARVFDQVDPVGGPSFHDDHLRIADAGERQAVLDYLEAGTPVLMTPSLMDDVVEKDRTTVVPMNFRTDGTWIWTDTISYYLAEYHLAPEPELLAHIQEEGLFSWSPDQETLDEVIAFIFAPPEPGDELVWEA